MKMFLAFVLSLMTGVAFGQFRKGADNMCATTYAHDSQDLAKDSAVTGLNIFPMEFRFDESVTVPVYNQLECLYFEFSLSPESSQEVKLAFAEELKSRLNRFDFLFRSPNLKAVYFHVSEKIFMTDAEQKKAGANWQKNADINLKNAWISFGSALQSKYPHLKFYAENWNW